MAPESVPGFKLSFLSPYSPELNPIESVGKLTRHRCLHEQYFSQSRDLIEDVEAQFNEGQRGNATLRQLCAITQNVVFRSPFPNCPIGRAWKRVSWRLYDEETTPTRTRPSPARS
ncbi:MAG: transposase [Acidobacteriales bacterium]|nr:transposase [Terriglobales bacterium]